MFRGNQGCSWSSSYTIWFPKVIKLIDVWKSLQNVFLYGSAERRRGELPPGI